MSGSSDDGERFRVSGGLSRRLLKHIFRRARDIFRILP